MTFYEDWYFTQLTKILVKVYNLHIVQHSMYIFLYNKFLRLPILNCQ